VEGWTKCGLRNKKVADTRRCSDIAVNVALYRFVFGIQKKLDCNRKKVNRVK